MKLLCLCQDESLNERIQQEADQRQWSAVVLRDRARLNQAVSQFDPDLVLVEVDGLADLDWWKGSEFKPTHKPVIFLNEEQSSEYFAQSLDLGADGFLPKPLFSSHYFEARIKSLLRRKHFASSRRQIVRLNLVLDGEHHCAEVAEKRVALTLTEFKILRELACDEVKVVTRQEIQTRVFGSEKLSTRSLDVHVCALRKKIKPSGLDIESVRGVGYRLSSCPN